MHRSPDDLAHRLAAHQEGVVALWQVRGLGFTPDQIHHRRHRGRWELARPGVVRMAGAPPTWGSEVMAGWLLVRGRAVVSRWSAARLLGLDGFAGGDNRTTADGSDVHFTSERGRLDRIGGLRVHSARTLEAIDTAVVRRPLPAAVRRDRALRTAGLVTSFSVTSASRTIIDLAAVLTEDRLGAAIDSACRLGLTSPSFLARRIGELRVPGRAGVARVEDALVDSGGHSVLERRFLRALREVGLPSPHTQVVWRHGNQFIGRVDFDFAPALLVVEVGGRRGHSSDGDRARDARRRNELQSLGVTVLEFTYRHVLAEPGETAAIVASHLARLGHPVRSGRT